MTASLQIVKGMNEGRLIPLNGDRFSLGRNPECSIHIPISSVSREHAQIVRVQGRFFIEDLQSRNGTFVNNDAVTARRPLKHNDRIRICDFLATFVDSSEDDHAEEPLEDTSTIEATLSSHGSHLLLEKQPAEKLRTLLDISSGLSKTLQLNDLLPKIVDSLFDLFRQADRCFLIQSEEPAKEGAPQRLQPRVVRTRRPQDEANARYSSSIVRKCLATAQAFLTDDAQRDAPLSQSVVDFRIRSVMCVPLCRADETAFGVIQLDTQDRSKKFTEEDLKLLWGVAHQASIALENSRLLEEAVVQAKFKRDLEVATQVQKSFLPRSLPRVQGYDFHAYYESAQEVGGDYYGFIPLPDGRMAVALGDVAGKGIPAALLMAKLSSEARFCLLTENDPATAISKLNDLICEFAGQAHRFVTLSLAVVDPATHQLTLVSAGHPSPLLHRARTGELVEILNKDQTGPLLGIMEGVPYTASTISLDPGDCVLIFTDGVTDPVDASGSPFGMDRLRRTLQEMKEVHPRLMVEGVVRAIEVHSAGQSQFDDITLVSLGRSG